MSNASPLPALVLDIARPAKRPIGVRSIAEGATAATIDPLVDGLDRLCRERIQSLARAIAHDPIAAAVVSCEPRVEALSSSRVPELELVTRWHGSHAAPLRRTAASLGRLADEVLTLRSLLRDAEHTARCLGPGGEPNLALALAWITDAEGTLEAAISHTNRPPLSYAPQARVPYVYNVWSGIRGHGDALLRFVAWETGGEPITLHPLHEGVADHYIRRYPCAAAG